VVRAPLPSKPFPRPERSGAEVAARILSGVPLAVVGLLLCLFGGLYELMALGETTTPGRDQLRLCEFGAASALLGGGAAAGIGLLLTAALIVAPLVVRREVARPTWIKLAATIAGVYALAAGSIAYGLWVGFGCPFLD
jgi:hypothetical protein